MRQTLPKLREQKRSFKYLWLNDQFKKIRSVIPENQISSQEIKKMLLDEYEKRYLADCRLYNNTEEKKKEISQEDFINIFLQNPYILSGYGVFFKQHNDARNISADGLNFLLESRKAAKKKQGEAEYGSKDYVYYKVTQKTFKVLANSFYGILGEKNSIFYNSAIQNSITLTGQDLTGTAIITLEQFLSNNAPFYDTDEVLEFIGNVMNETYTEDISQYLDKKISKESCVKYLVHHKVYSDCEINEDIVRLAVDQLSEEQVQRVYYKNQIIKLCENSYFKNLLAEILKYNFTDKPDEEMVENLKILNDKIIQFCFYNCTLETRYRRTIQNNRKSIITIDTDSVFINLNNYMKIISGWLSLDKNNDLQQMTIFNVLMSIITNVFVIKFDSITEDMGIVGDPKAIIKMKPEFVYRRILLTRNKKSYAGIITGELGKLLEKPDLDIKGLSIKKSNVPARLRKEFTDILVKKVLEPKEIDVEDILKEFDSTEVLIENSIKEGKTEFLLPRAIQAIESYKAPVQMEQFRAALIWNALEPTKEISFPENFNIVKLFTITDPEDLRLEDLKENYPEKFEALKKKVFNVGKDQTFDISKFGFSVVAIPKNESRIPEYLIPLINIEEMVAKNIANGLIILESLGICCEKIATDSYKTNIIEI